ncbi:hypothetical protein TW81_09855 [Vibrio galatheae]|uniref:DUF935 family protein n=1 Tax=Vibrio galatheae TaxID=579748 RepID=A0A0F4NMG6_9VIBR|nr:DUF935 family protein [Vibrio galatheae]KJY83291.1 hypothetical protein TW81_09855 [Vibrio galatheae]
MGFFTKAANRIEKGLSRAFHSSDPQPKQTVKGRPVTLTLSDKQEAFGAIDIAEIKDALENEDFAQLQSLYFFMMRDIKIASSVLMRKQPLLSLPYRIETDNEEFAEFIKNHVDIDALLNSLTHAIYYGVSLVDVDYRVIEQKLAPSFRHISSRYLYADKEDGKLKPTIDHLYIKQGSDKLYLSNLQPERRIFHKHPIDIGEITDFSLASKLVWYFALKHITIAHNMQYFDAVATPPLVMKTDSDEEEAVEMLYTMKSQSVAAIDKEDSISYLTLTQGSKAEFLSFINYIDSQITTLILGNTLSTGDGKTGSYSQSKVHENRQKELKSFDARLIGQTITDYLNELEKMNYGTPKGVRFVFDLTEKKDLKELSEVVKNLSGAGYEIAPEEIESQFGFKVKLKQTETQSTPSLDTNARQVEANALNKVHNNQEVNNQTQPIYEDELDSQVPGTQAEEEALVETIYNLLANAKTYDEAYQLLLEQYTDVDLSVLEASLFKAIGNSQILADAEVQLEEIDTDA